MRPIAVVTSDVHYSMNTKELADFSCRTAIDKAAELGVPWLDNGDLTNDKDVLRGTYVNMLLKTVKYAQSKNVKMYFNAGNHSMVNQHGTEHTLHFLEPYCTVIGEPGTYDGFNIIPYQHDMTKFYEAINKFPKGSIVFGHQGTLGGYLGDYVKDDSAIDPQKILSYVTYLGHFHRHYKLHNTISCGNPYSLSFGESNDGPKGFLVVYEDGSFTREILSLRKHTLLERDVSKVNLPIENYNPGDLLWLKVTGPESELNKIDKKKLGMSLIGHNNYKLDKIVTEVDTPVIEIGNLSEGEVLDLIIDELPETSEQKQVLKQLWRDL